MKKWIVLLLASVFAVTAYAGRIVINGKPIELEPHPGYYTFPKYYSWGNGTYHYITMAGIQRVCYMKPQPDLASLNSLQIVILVDNIYIYWTCYRYDPRYFEIDY